MADPGSNATRRPPADRAPFFVGVTGYMDLVPEEIEGLKKRVRDLLCFLRCGAEGKVLQRILDDLVPPASDSTARSAYAKALSNWRGLGPETPIVVMCNLAPGADTLVAELVLKEFSSQNVSLRLPLPFPPHLYVGASTFVREQFGTPLAGNQQRQQDFLRVLHKLQCLDANHIALANGTKHLPRELEESLRATNSEVAFTVLLRDDLELAPHELDAKLAADCESANARHLRYYAAGEFLAVTCHLLLVVSNGQREANAAGSSAVLDARLNGPRPGLLPMTSDLPQAHGGPVWHLLATRPKQAEVPVPDTCGLAREATFGLPPVRILHPDALNERNCAQSLVRSTDQVGNLRLQQERLGIFARIGESIRDFNATRVAPAAKSRDLFREKLDDPKASVSLHDSLLKEAPDLHRQLEVVSDVQERCSRISDAAQGRLKRTLRWLFALTFAAAIALHFFTHWHTDHGTAHDEPSSTTLRDHAHDLNSVQKWAGAGAIVLTGVGIAIFGWQRFRKIESLGHDTRAIAEGLRVQFYWNLAGVGASVSANYMSRHRSELDWIRGVIRATSFPYDRFVRWFDDLPDRLQFQAFRAVQNNWVRHQLAYFNSASHREHHRLHLWHSLGAATALAGLVTFVRLVAESFGPAVQSILDIVCHHWTVAALLALNCGAAWYLAARAAIRAAAAGGGERPIFPGVKKAFTAAHDYARKYYQAFTKESQLLAPLGWLAYLLAAAYCGGPLLVELFATLIPTPEQTSLTQTTIARRWLHGVRNFVAYVPMALAISCGVCTLSNTIAERYEGHVPHGFVLSVIGGGVLLLAGAMSIAWAEKNLHSELAYQYNTMALLFRVADRQLSQRISEFQVAIHAGDQAGQRAAIAKIRQLLFELGTEALDENAEWLLLHRARPLEPVLAG